MHSIRSSIFYGVRDRASTPPVYTMGLHINTEFFKRYGLIKLSLLFSLAIFLAIYAVKDVALTHFANFSSEKSHKTLSINYSKTSLWCDGGQFFNMSRGPLKYFIVVLQEKVSHFPYNIRKRFETKCW